MRWLLCCLCLLSFWKPAQAFTVRSWSPETQTEIERVQPQMLDEHTLFDKSKTYQLNILTKEPTGAHIIASPADTLSHGWHDVLVLDENDRILQRLTGYFMDGYYIGNTPLKAKVIKRFSPRKNYQEVYYFLQSDPLLQVFFIGKMISFVKGGKYTEFNLCKPFQMLLFTENKELFSDPATLKNLSSIVKSYASTICPDVQSFVFSASDNPEKYEEDIFFQAFYKKNDKGEWVEDTQYALNTQQQPEVQEITRAYDQPAAFFNERKIDFPLHLLKASQVTDRPMEGIFIAHIAKLDQQNAWIDYPFPMSISPVKFTGWALIKGVLTGMSDKEKKKAGVPLRQEAARVHILKIRECSMEHCQDLYSPTSQSSPSSTGGAS